MKTVKIALLATVALVAATAGARSESLADLKAQIETLNSRIALLETSPSVPAGYNLMSFAKAPVILSPGESLGPQAAKMATTMQVTPTADVPYENGPGMPSSAAAQWTGHVKAAIVHERVDLLGTITEETHIVSDAELNLRASNDTAVGEVGVHVRMAASYDGGGAGDVSMTRAYGWWKAAPELSFRAGFKDSIGGVGHGNDKCSCEYNSYTGIVGGTEDSTQFELRYASGPIEAAIAVEHHDDYNDDIDTDGAGPDVTGSGQTYAVAGELKWSGDTVSGEISGFWGEVAGDTEAIAGAPPTGDVDLLNDTAVQMWQIGAGVSTSFDAISLSAAAGYGEIDSSTTFWEASLFGAVNLSDSLSFEAGAGYEAKSTAGFDLEGWGVAGGLYWSPVDKLTLGAEASWKQVEAAGLDSSRMTADLVSVFKF